MKNHYEQAPRFSATGLTTGTILALIVAMGVSLLFDHQAADASAQAAAATKVSTHA
jgi:hypothetical protein